MGEPVCWLSGPQVEGARVVRVDGRLEAGLNGWEPVECDLPLEQAVWIGPVARVLHGLDRVRHLPQETALVLGCGALGLLAVQLCPRYGAGRVVAASRSARRLELAVELGAQAATPGVEADLVLHCREGEWGEGQWALSKGGTLAFLDGPPDPVEFDTTRLHYDQLTVVGCSGYRREHAERARELVPRLDTTRLVRWGVVRLAPG
ncbi:MAG: zinc-binding dehydrogenase [Candidatus Eremiobacterota bacterium]